MEFAISVLQNRLTLLQNQVIDINKYNCNKNVKKQIKLKEQITELNKAIRQLEGNQITIRVTDISNAQYFDREIHYDRKRLIK